MYSLEVLDHYTQYHRRWFESAHHYVPSPEHLAVYLETIPDNWELQRSGLWYFAKPATVQLPEQGWKLHISVRTNDAVAALRQALPILREEDACFKFLVDSKVTALMNGKLSFRGSSGKFVTIYPCSSEHFYRLGQRLTEEMQEFNGPYILSDKRWPGSMCVYYRYGGFRARTMVQIDGRREHVIISPDGELVPDVRNPFWSPPEWVRDPFPLESQDTEVTLNGGRFLVVSALGFSNRGGVYRAVDKLTGKEVVIKEARPHVEIGSHRADAIAVLKKEYRLLLLLAGSGYFVQPVAFFREWEHEFLVEEFLPGDHLGRFTILHNPLYLQRVTAAAVDNYFVQMRQLWAQIARAIAAAHEVRIMLGDLSFSNISVIDGSRIQIFDLDTAVEDGIDAQVGLHTPGLASPRALQSGISDEANDYYALGAIILGSIMLVTGITGFYPQARPVFLRELTVDLGLPDELVTLINYLMEPPTPDDPIPDLVIKSIEQLPFGTGNPPLRAPRLALPATQRLNQERRAELRHRVGETVDGIVRYVIGTADIDREDRLFPADLLVFETNPLSVAYGAAGVLYALRRLRGEVPDHLLAWLLHHPVPNDQYPPGLYVGQAGISWVLSELGYLDRAVQIMRSARRHKLLWEKTDVLHGAAGYGLACLKLSTTQAGQEFLDEAIRVGEHLIASCTRDERGVYWPDKNGGVPLGYAYGGSGIALFLLYLHLATGDPIPLQLGREALDFDLAQGVWVDGKLAGFPAEATDGSQEPLLPRVISPYWEAGSAGIGTTLIRYLAVASDATLKDWVAHLVADARYKYTVFPQLFHGLAGLGNFMLDVWEHTGDEQYLTDAWQVAEGAILFRIDRDEGITFPGEQARRESADFATGAAGVGLFLNRLLKANPGLRGNFNFVVDELLPDPFLEP